MSDDYPRTASRLMQWAAIRSDVQRSLDHKFLDRGDLSPEATQNILEDAWNLADELRSIADEIELAADALQQQFKRWQEG